MFWIWYQCCSYLNADNDSNAPTVHDMKANAGFDEPYQHNVDFGDNVDPESYGYIKDIYFYDIADGVKK